MGHYSDRSTYWRYTPNSRIYWKYIPNKLQIYLYKFKIFFTKRLHLLKRKGLFGYFPPQEQIDQFFAKVDQCNNCNWAMTTFGKMCELHEEGYQKLMKKSHYKVTRG